MRMYRFSAAVIRTESIIIIENDKFEFHPFFFDHREKNRVKSFYTISKIYVVFLADLRNKSRSSITLTHDQGYRRNRLVFTV